MFIYEVLYCIITSMRITTGHDKKVPSYLDILFPTQEES